MKYLALLIGIILIFGCSKDTDIKPAEIKYGQDVCAVCSMIISETLYSSQYILTDGKVKKFDDIGCMMENIKQTKDELDKISAIFVRDFISNNWINAKNAHFLRSKKIITPMGHGIIAFESMNDLKETQSKTSGKDLGTLLDLINK
jgi:copper chaperone NosL